MLITLVNHVANWLYLSYSLLNLNNLLLISLTWFVCGNQQSGFLSITNGSDCDGGSA